MSDDTSTVDNIVAVFGAGVGLLIMVVWHIHVTYPEVAGPEEILSSGLLAISAYGLFVVALLLTYTEYTNRVEANHD